MKLHVSFVIAVAAVVGSNAQTSLPATTTPPAIVLVHGRDQPAEQREAIEKAWRDAVVKDLERSSVFTTQAPADIRMFWYANLLAGEDSCRYATGVRELAARAPGWQLWKGIRDRLVSAAGQLPSGIQRSLLEQRMQDVTTYLSSGAIACSVDNKFAETLQSAAEDPRRPGKHRPLIVIAHSLGSMVVYKNLINRPPPDTPVYLLTIGSMLADPGVQRTLLGTIAEFPAPVPLPVRWWRNFVNKGDFLAFDASKAFTSSEATKKPVDEPVDLDGTDRHSAVRYISGAVFIRRLTEAVCLASEKSCGK